MQLRKSGEQSEEEIKYSSKKPTLANGRAKAYNTFVTALRDRAIEKNMVTREFFRDIDALDFSKLTQNDVKYINDKFYRRDGK